VPPHKGMMCDVIGPASLPLVFKKDAGLDNPSSPGTYKLAATHGKRAFTTSIRIG
jgi:hypothetical protein